jgi:hypothetical protein
VDPVDPMDPMDPRDPMDPVDPMNPVDHGVFRVFSKCGYPSGLRGSEREARA